MAMPSKGLLTEINEDDTRFALICCLISKLLHISKDMMSIKKSGHLFSKKSFVEKWNLLTQ